MFNIEGLMGKLVTFGEDEDFMKMGTVVGGYLNVAPTSNKQGIVLLVDCGDDGVCEARAADCVVQ